MAWYEKRTCAVCNKTIGKRYFWQEKPRLLDADANASDCTNVPDASAEAALATHVLVCTACYYNRFGDAKALATKQRAPNLTG